MLFSMETEGVSPHCTQGGGVEGGGGGDGGGSEGDGGGGEGDGGGGEGEGERPAMASKFRDLTRSSQWQSDGE